MSEPALPLPAGRDACVCLTFDVDADTGVEWRQLDRRLTARSEGEFGIRRGLPRILELLARRELRATFYVPGDVADAHPDAVRAILDGGHEVGHHGYAHLFSDRVSEREQREEVERGLEALARAGAEPAGYRSPGWELTPFTLALLLDAGFAYDSSLMGDDRPYVVRHGGRELLELPVHWSLDDWVWFGFTRDGGGQAPDAERWEANWWHELQSALADRRLATFTMHPDVIGRGYRIRALERLIERMAQTGRVWFATQAEVARAAGGAEAGR